MWKNFTFTPLFAFFGCEIISQVITWSKLPCPHREKNQIKTRALHANSNHSRLWTIYLKELWSLISPSLVCYGPINALNLHEVCKYEFESIMGVMNEPRFFFTFTALSILNFYNPFYDFYDAFFVPLSPANPGTIKIGIYLIIQPISWFRILSLETISRQCLVVTGMGNCVNLTSPD